ncbi:heterokaryon incompatibility protein [Fusarium sporotrichioides]|uniref:Heterokaryon incompatibility protein n=1 Tax=Fusarium sporotrichioides TaxID=5514 RepID=A0A395RQX2_FUSSP|nr:heterokaryon incompatibility protein [Fusarium sporotrichioides]
MQDSLDDWSHEATEMGKVYRNSSCNIAASSASHSRQGCLYPRNPRILQPESLDSYGNELKDLYLFNRSFPLKPFQLYTRAWVLQEALLAPRTLDCGQSQLYWRCDATKASEEFPGGYPIAMAAYFSHPAHSSSSGCPSESLRAIVAEISRSKGEGDLDPQEPRPCTLVKSLAGADPGLATAAKHWCSIVDAYCGMSLTFEADMPIAIHGAIEAFRPFLGQCYAGMWEYLMPAHLVWMPTWPVMPGVKNGILFYNFCPNPELAYADISSSSWFHPDYSLISHVTQINVISPADIRLHLQAPIFKATYVGDARETIKRALQTCAVSPPNRSSIKVVNKHAYVKWEITGYDTVKNDMEESTIRACFDVQAEEDMARDIHLVVISKKSGIEGLVLAKEDNGMYSRLGAFYAMGPVKSILEDREKSEVILV